MTVRIGVIGATGIIGRALTEKILAETTFSISVFASAKTQTRTIQIGNTSFPVLEIHSSSFKNLDVAIFAATREISQKWISIAKKYCYVIDLSDFYRLNKKIPLIISDINGNLVRSSKIIACPNCMTSLLLQVLHPLHKEFTLLGYETTTFQSVSGAGHKAILAWQSELRNDEANHSEMFTKRIANNFIPNIGEISKSGYSTEEISIIRESQKILDNCELKVCATCVRVSVRRGHGASITAQFSKNLSLKKVIKILSGCKNLQYGDMTPLEVEGNDKIFFSKIRKNAVLENGISFWITGDQIIAGTVSNVIKILNTLAENLTLR